MTKEIVPYNPDHDKAIDALLQEFVDDSLSEYGVDINSGMIQTIAKKAVGRVLLVDGEVQGIIAGTFIVPHLSVTKIFQEMVWFVSKQYRKYGVYLLNETEKWAKQQGCKHMVMISMYNSGYEKICRFYNRTGYKPMESHFIKEL